MITSTTLPSNALARRPSPTALLLDRLAALLRGNAVSTTRHATNESASALYARAAQYERTQPSFAADLRAAAEAMDRLAPPRAR